MSKIILLLEDIANMVMENRGKEQCLFGDTMKLSFKKHRTFPYEFIYHSLPEIPASLNNKFLTIPFLSGEIRAIQVRERIRELKEAFPFIDTFAFVSERQHTIKYLGQEFESFGQLLKFIKVKDSRPIEDFPKKPYYVISKSDLEKNNTNWQELSRYIAEKIDEINKKYKAT